MAHKVVIIADPGLDTAFAIALALNDPGLHVLALLATPGNVPAEQATQNVHTIIEQLDPPRWPRLAAPLVKYEADATDMHGPGGLGGVTFPCVKKHTTVASDKQLVELVHEFPHQVAVVALGPLTVLATALDRDPDLPSLVERIVCLGGTWHEPGNASPVAEFHFACDPASAVRRVVRCGAPVAVIPLDVSRKVIYSPTDLLELPSPDSATCRFLRQIVPFGIRATANRYGIEGFHLHDVLGIIALARPSALTTRQMSVDVETRGDLTRGMCVVDARIDTREKPNVHLGIGVDVSAVHEYIDETLGRAT